jgi:hypothetical protein
VTVGSLADPEDAIRFALILRNIASESDHRRELIENWLWCLRDRPEAGSAHERLLLASEDEDGQRLRSDRKRGNNAPPGESGPRKRVNSGVRQANTDRTNEQLHVDALENTPDESLMSVVEYDRYKRGRTLDWVAEVARV